MDAALNIDMWEATRLTREGRLEEAMAVLRGALPTAPSPAVRPDFKGDARQSLSVRTAPILDMVPPSAESGSWTSSQDETHPSERPGGVGGPPIRGAFGRKGRRGFPSGLDGIAGCKVIRTPPLPPGARFLERTYADTAGSRTYKLYVPSGCTGEARPLVMMLHGCTQSPDDFAAGTRMNELAEEQDFLVAYPAQPQSANASRCWNWFNPGDQQRDQGEPSLLAGITREIMREFAVEPGRIFVAGLSAGGAAAAIMGANYPDLYAAIGVHSGLACGAASDMPSAFAAMRQGGSPAPAGLRRHGEAGPIPTIVFHGDRDPTVNSVNGDQVIAQSKATADLRATVIRGQAPGGMRYTRIVQADASGRPVLEQWLLHGAGHAWSGGSPVGSHTEPRGPDASREMVRFFLQQPSR